MGLSKQVMHQTLFKRQSGNILPYIFEGNESNRRALNLQLSRNKDVEHTFTGAVTSLDLERNEHRYLLSGCSDGSVRIHDLYNFSGSSQYTAMCLTNTVATTLRDPLPNSIECVSWYPSDNRVFITSGHEKKLKLWDANTQIPVETFPSKGRILNHACSSSQIAIGNNTSLVELVDLRSGNACHELRGHSGAVMGVAWSPRDTTLLASAGTDGRTLFWDVRSAAGTLCTLDNGTGTTHKGPVHGLAFTPDGLHLLTLGVDSKLQLWETNQGKLLPVNYGRITSDLGRHVQMAVSSNMVFVPSQGCVRLLDIWTGDCAGDLCGHFNRVLCCVYRDVYQELYSGGRDRNILVWDADEPNVPDDSKNETGRDQWSSDDENGD